MACSIRRFDLPGDSPCSVAGYNWYDVRVRVRLRLAVVALLCLRWDLLTARRQRLTIAANSATEQEATQLALGSFFPTLLLSGPLEKARLFSVALTDTRSPPRCHLAPRRNAHRSAVHQVCHCGGGDCDRRSFLVADLCVVVMRCQQLGLRTPCDL